MKKNRLIVTAIAIMQMIPLVCIGPSYAVVNPDGNLENWQQRPEVVQVRAFSDRDGFRYYGSSCTGTLIAKKIVLTAAHCLDDSVVSGFIAVVGADSESEGSAYEASSWLTHPDFNFQAMSSDIGLLFLSRSVNNVTPVNLPPKGDRFLDQMQNNLLFGWGVNENMENPSSLGFARLDDYTESATSGIRSFNPETMIAAGRMLTNGKFAGACSGDSGGPLLSTFAGTVFVIGVVSYGAQGCTAAAPTAFTRVSAYIEWISESI